MRFYLKTPDSDDRRERMDDDITGRLAMYRLLLAQREFCGLDAAAARREVERAEADGAAHRDAPPGTVFVSRAGKGDDIWVVGPNREEIYVGPRAGYPDGGG